MNSRSYYNNVTFDNQLFKIDAVNGRLQVIIDEFKKISHVTHILTGDKQILNFFMNDTKHIYHLASGEVEIHNIENNMIIGNIYTPDILGVSTMLMDTERYYIKSIGNAEFYSVTRDDFIQMIEDKKLWKNISEILINDITSYYERDLTLSQNNVYNIIKDQLELLWEQNLVKRKDISVFNYVLNRTPVSRSSLNKILKELITGGYINLKHGKLISMNKLPSGF